MNNVHQPQILSLVTIQNDSQALLRNQTQKISFPLEKAVEDFIADLKYTMENLKSPFGKPAGLAATQVGRPWRIIAMQIPAEAKKIRKDVEDILPLTIWINPSYTPVGETKNIDWEGCYSVPDKMGEVFRYDSIQYLANTLDGKTISGTARGFFARLIQHETGHLNGEVYTDLLTDQSRFGDVDEMMKIRQQEIASSTSPSTRGC